jgi:cell wall-associated NlpC family hydrolase
VKIAAGIAVAFVAFMVVMTMSISASIGGQAPTLSSPMAVAGIPPLYLQLYVAAAEKEGLDWAILAAIGSIETDHGRSNAKGVHSGVNAYGCCAGPMQFSLDTWKTYGNGGNIYDPADAIPAAARYLRAGGAPKDYHRAILAYNHSEAYFRDVTAKADEYRSKAVGVVRSGDATVQAIWDAADQLDGMNIPYVYGGGHIQPAAPNPGLDCSSSVSWVLQHAGFKIPTMDSTRLMSWGDSGPGGFVTIYANPTHTFMKIAGRYFGTSNFAHMSLGTGPHWFVVPAPPGYMKGFVVRHPPGM